MTAGKQFRSSDSITTVYAITSQRASSINLTFDRFKLAKGANLYIYTTDKRILYGPVTDAHNPDSQTFWTDVLPGTGIVIQVTAPATAQASQLNIATAVHGYTKAFTGFGSAAWCERDIMCDEGVDWRDEGNAVARVLVNGADSYCSGALINNTCQNLRPYFLTAFHCVDSNGNSDGSVAERNQVDNWVFRFKYESPSCNGPEPGSWITFNSATYRAGFWQTDFALVELDQRPQNGDPFTYAGWSRSTTAATSGVAIHHPQADVKMISIDQNALTNIAVASNWGNPLLHPANTHWQALFETGTVEPGSSGSPIFNQNSQIVGQLHGDFLNANNDFCGNRRGHYGRFDVSWNGGGTNDTRLSNWLDPTGTGATTLAQMAMPSISGPAILCTNGAYTLNNVPAGVPVSWSVSTPSGVTPTSGSGTVANLTMVNPEDVTITFTIGCDATGTISRRIYVGPPQFSHFLVDGNYTSNATICANQSVSLEALPNDVSASYSWSSSSYNGYIMNSTSPSTMFYAYSPDCYYLNLTISNSCGNNYQTLTICANNCYYRHTVYPNPAKDQISIKFDDFKTIDGMPDQITLFSEVTQKQVADFGSKAIFESLDQNGIFKIPVETMPRGTYYLHIKRNRSEDKPLDITRIILE
ncbi:trypsin-like peptidase domain-containing protein [Arcticibacter sp.]|uniref:trypsin-like peptidase domain-containing protein n=1 Tax=Arcticibacter sp. TaxID=1872630 RepID=UPI00388E38A8